MISILSNKLLSSEFQLNFEEHSLQYPTIYAILKSY